MEPVTQASFGEIDRAQQAPWPQAKTVRPRGWRRRKLPAELAEFHRRLILSGHSPMTADVLTRAVGTMLNVASRHLGRPTDVRELFLDGTLLALAASDAKPLRCRRTAELMKGTVGQRRVAARCFLRLMEDVLGDDADQSIARFEEALRQRCEQVGQTYRLRPPKPRERRTYTPPKSEVEALLRAVGSSGRWFLPARNTALVSLLATLGLRLGSAIAMDGGDFHRLSSGLWVIVREKCKAEPVSIRVPTEVEGVLQHYVSAFNSEMRKRGLSKEIGLGVSGPLWRDRSGRPWSSQAAAEMMKIASIAAGIRPITPHALRRYVAEQLTEVMSRSQVTDALRWRSSKVLDEHYAPPAGSSLRRLGEHHPDRNEREVQIAPA